MTVVYLHSGGSCTKDSTIYCYFFMDHVVHRIKENIRQNTLNFEKKLYTREYRGKMDGLDKYRLNC